MPNIEKDRYVWENASDCILDVTTVVDYGHLWIGDAKQGKPALQPCEHLFNFGIELCLAKSLKCHGK